MSWERNVEVLVVADYLMAGYHGSDLQHYVLTLMSIVSRSRVIVNGGLPVKHAQYRN